MIKLRAHHIYSLVLIHGEIRGIPWPLNRIYQILDSISYRGTYGIRHRLNVNKIYKKIFKNNEHLKVKITDTLDDICLPYCKLKNELCKRKRGDIYFAKEVGIKIGKLYSADYIADFINENYYNIITSFLKVNYLNI